MLKLSFDNLGNVGNLGNLLHRWLLNSFSLIGIRDRGQVAKVTRLPKSELDLALFLVF